MPQTTPAWYSHFWNRFIGSRNNEQQIAQPKEDALILPPELLLLVFELAFRSIPSANGRVRLTNTLRRVSKTWNSLILSLPELWTTIVIRELAYTRPGQRPATNAMRTASTAQRAERVWTTINRAAGHKLDVLIDVPSFCDVHVGRGGDGDNFQRLRLALSPLRACGARWRSLTLVCAPSWPTSETLMMNLSKLLPEDLALEAVHLRTPAWLRIAAPVADDEGTYTPEYLARLLTRALRSLRVSDAEFAEWASPRFAACNLVSLEVAHHLSVDRRLIAYLSSLAPSLEVLTLSTLTITDDVADAHATGDPTLPRAALRRLRVLQFTAASFSADRAELLFRLLSTPALEQLEVRETSVFFWAGFRAFLRRRSPTRGPAFKRLRALTLTSTPMLLRTGITGRLPIEFAHASPALTHLVLVDMDAGDCLRFLGRTGMGDGPRAVGGTVTRTLCWPQLKTLALTGEHGLKEHVLYRLLQDRKEQGAPIACLRLDRQWMRTLAHSSREQRMELKDFLIAPFAGNAITAPPLGDADW